MEGKLHHTQKYGFELLPNMKSYAHWKAASEQTKRVMEEEASQIRRSSKEAGLLSSSYHQSAKPNFERSGLALKSLKSCASVTKKKRIPMRV